MTLPTSTARGHVGALVFGLWIAARHGMFGGAITQVRITALQLEGVGGFLNLDFSWLIFAASMGLLFGAHLGEAAARTCLALLAAAQAASYALTNLHRYFAGDALAWDLANFVQPLWRTAHGASMAATWSSRHPLWADHGSFAFFLFAPLTRLGSDPATWLVLTQSALVAATGPALFLLARRLDFDRPSALGVCAALTSSRALANAAAFDFHPECALPLVLVVLCLLHVSRRQRLFLAFALLGVCLKDGSAMVVAMTAMWLGLRPWRPATMAVSLVAASVACFDVLLLPQLSGWPSYVSMNSSAPVDPLTAIASTLGRAISQGAIGWLHPIAWVAGSPWILAAALSPKLAVKGLAFQYGFLWVPVGAVGTLFALRWLRSSRRSQVALPWAVFTIAANAPLPLPTGLLRDYHAFSKLRSDLALAIPASASAATDACTAPLIMDRMELVGLCQLDVEAFARGQGERWTDPSSHAWRADVVVIDRLCRVHGDCLGQQLGALRAHGYSLRRVVLERWGVFARLR